MKSKSILYFIALFFSSFFGQAQTSLDSLITSAFAMDDDTAKVKELLNIGGKLRYSDVDSATLFMRQAVDIAEKVGHPQWLFNAYVRLGAFIHWRGDYKNAKTWKTKALDIAKKHLDEKSRGWAYSELATSFRRLGQLDSAFYHYTNAETEFANINDDFAIAKVHTALGRMYLEKLDVEIAEQYLQKAWKVIEKSDSRVDIGYTIYIMANLYFTAENYEQFGVFAQKWKEFNQQSKHKSPESIDKLHVGTFTLFFQDDLRAVEKLNGAIEFQKNNGNTFMTAMLLMDLGILHYGQNRYAPALNAFYESEKYIIDTNDEVNQLHLYRYIYDTNKKLENIPTAFKYLEKYHSVYEKIQNEKMLKNLSDLEVKYETEKVAQENKMQALEIKQKTTQNNLLIASSILLALLALTIFVNYRSRIRTNQKLAAQESEIQRQRIQQLEQEKKVLSLNSMIEGQEQERMRIANDLHDGLGGLLTSVKSHFNSLNGGIEKNTLFEKTNYLIDEACVEVRRISHNMMPRALTLSGLEGALEDLAENINRQGIKCDLEIMGLKELPHTQSVMVYRLVQELTNNILKHAEAKNILLQLLQNSEHLTIIVEDDGKGFNVEEALQKKGLGLTSVQSRVEFLKGEIDWDSVIGEGTTVNIHVPV
ncbi:MAG: sensor histidine kinase [Bacteroidota bacterium]